MLEAIFSKMVMMTMLLARCFSICLVTESFSVQTWIKKYEKYERWKNKKSHPLSFTYIHIIYICITFDAAVSKQYLFNDITYYVSPLVLISLIFVVIGVFFDTHIHKHTTDLFIYFYSSNIITINISQHQGMMVCI
jgi:hypothetical protein